MLKKLFVSLKGLNQFSFDITFTSIKKLSVSRQQVTANI